MHLWLGLSSLALTFWGCLTLIHLLRSLRSWKSRRFIQGLVLLLPLFSFGLGVSGLHHFSGQPCLLGAPAWDAILEVALPLGMGLLVLGAIIFGVTRLLLMLSLMKHAGVPADPELQEQIASLAGRLGLPPVQGVVTPADRPIACTIGLFRPTVLFSTWMLDHLDRREWEAVVIHELEHIARRDYFLNWITLVLRDAFFYFPTSRLAYQQVQQEKELICDELTAQVTRRPLSLASALTKVWLHTTEAPVRSPWESAQHLADRHVPMQKRIERLLKPPFSERASLQELPSGKLAWQLLLFLTIIGMGIINISTVLTLMGCSPETLLATLF